MNNQQPTINRGWTAVQDHARQYAEFTYVYPVISRRSAGLSIGVNLNPDKVCNFDCVYCEVDRRIPGKTKQVDLDQIQAELTSLLDYATTGGLAADPKFRELPPHLSREVKDIAFSGDGEPTMVHNFADCVRTVVAVKAAAELDQTKIVLITDAAGLDKVEVRRGLELMDAHQGEVWAKLDAGTEAYFRQVNRSHVRFERILNNLLTTAQTRPIVVQTLFFKVHGEAMPEDELAAYCERLNDIIANDEMIREVQAYTIARPTPEHWATRLAANELAQIAATVRDRTHLEVLTFE